MVAKHEFPMRLLELSGQKEGEDRTVSSLTLSTSNIEFAVVAGYDFLANPQSQSVSGCALGGEECVEYIVSHQRINPNSIVGDAQHQPFPARRPVAALATANQQTSPERHGFECVADKVIQNLTNVALEADYGVAGSELFFHVHTCIAQAAFVNAHHGRE